MLADRLDLPRVLTGTDAQWLGLSRAAVRHAVAARGWRPLTRGIVLTRAEEPTRDDWIQVGLALAGPAATLSGWDAVRLRGLGGARPPSERVLVLDRGGNHRTVGGVSIRPTLRPYSSTDLPADHPTLPHIPVVHTARAVADTALLCPTFPPVRALVTSAVQRGLCTPAELLAELESGPRGASRWLRQSLQDVLDGARSIAEAEAVDHLRRGQVPAFELNVPIIDARGTVLAVADVLWRELRAILEIDSREYHLGEQEWKHTMRRHNLLTRHGFAVAHDPPSEIRRQGPVWAATTASWLRRRAAELGVPYVAGAGPIRPATDGPAPSSSADRQVEVAARATTGAC